MSGRAGILFESVGIRAYPSPLSDSADKAVGGALGYQKFLAGNRRQLIVELGGRYATDDEGQRAVGFGSRYQLAIGKRGVCRLDGYAVFDQARELATSLRDEFRYGANIDLMVRF